MPHSPSPSMPESKNPCNCCIKFLISAGLIILVGWISYRFTKPRYYLISFSFPATNSSSSPHLAAFNLQIENKNRQIGIYHDNINLTLFSGPNLSSPISQCVIPSFYQGHLKTAEKPGNFTGGKLKGIAGESVFRVAADSAFRFKVLGWKSRHHAVSVSGDVQVDAGGMKTAKKGIRLVSSKAAVGSISLFFYAVVLLTFTLGLDG